MSFGWSAGDVFSAIKLINNIICSVQSIGGARDSFQELVTELHGLEKALSELDDLAAMPSQVPEVTALKYASCNCGAALERFYAKVRPFENSLGSKAQSRMKAAPRMNVSRNPDFGEKLEKLEEKTTRSLEHLNAEALQLRDVVDAIIQAQFARGFGSAKVRAREYELYDSSDGVKPVSMETCQGLIPGTTITMAMIIGQYKGSEKCPRIGCGSHKVGASGLLAGNKEYHRVEFTMWSLSYLLNDNYRHHRNERRSYKNISVYLTDLPPTPARFVSNVGPRWCATATGWTEYLPRHAGFYSAAPHISVKVPAEEKNEKTHFPSRKRSRETSPVRESNRPQRSRRQKIITSQKGS
ncbi:unnamed protein product [Sphagnum balticum]